MDRHGTEQNCSSNLQQASEWSSFATVLLTMASIAVGWKPTFAVAHSAVFVTL